MRKIKKRSTCPISYSLDILGDKWALLILRDMALNNKNNHKDFLRGGEGIASNILSDRLKTLESFGIIRGEKHPVKGNMKIYSLTQRGLDLVPVLIELWIWGAKYDPDSVVSPEEFQSRLDSKESTIKNYMHNARVAE
ncbi:MAG: helix-turn-helix domain-containing protein [Bacteroidota bacterium]